MKDGLQFSAYIKNSIVSRRSNIFFEKFIGLFFRNVDFDDESKANLQKYLDMGRVAFVSFQSTNTSLLIFLNLLDRYRYRQPELALDFTPYPFQVASSFVKMITRGIVSRYYRIKSERVSDAEYIKGVILGDKPVILSMMSKKMFKKRYIEKSMDTLQYLVEVQKESDVPVYVYPHIMFWSTDPERTRAIAAAVSTGDRGMLSAILTMVRSITPSFVRIPEPINIKELMEKAGTDDLHQVTRMLRTRLLEVFTQEKRSSLGPVIKTQQELMERVLYHRNVLDTISALMLEEGKPERRLRREAYKYFKEIAADFSIAYIKWFDWSLDFVYNKIFDGMFYDIEDFKKIREASKRGPLIITPSHRSHMDYLLMSSQFYRNKLIPPHIVAGSNLTFFPMGKIFRRSGAFFMRRSFKGLTLYSVVFKQYIKTLINEGYSIEFFIEGGRTRTGKILFPKMGILKYLIDSIDEGYNKDLIFIPASINYDRILEEKSYHMELKGKEKKKESTSDLVKSTKLLKRQYGKVYLTFNDPVSFQEFRAQAGESEDITTELGYHIVKKISEIILVTPFAATSASILASTAKGFSREAVRASMDLFLDYAAARGLKIEKSLETPQGREECIDYVLTSYQEDGLIMPMKVGGGKEGQLLEGFYVLNEDDRARLNFYKNTVIHYFLPVTYVSLTLLLEESRGRFTREDIVSGCTILTDLFVEEFVYPDAISRVENYVNQVVAFLERRGALSRSASGDITVNADRREEFVRFGRLVQDYLESYFIAFDTATGLRGQIGRKDMLLEVRKNGVRLYHLGEVKCAEALMPSNYENALKKLVKMGGLREIESSRKGGDYESVSADEAARGRDMVLGYLKTIRG